MTVFPIGIDKVLRKPDWAPSTVESGSRVVPRRDFQSRLIEAPITIDVHSVSGIEPKGTAVDI